MINSKNIIMNFSVLLALIILLALGTWQMDRKGQKAALLEKLERVNEDIIELQSVNINEDNLDSWLYRKLQIDGNFISDKNLFVFAHLSEPRGSYGGAGYWIMTPFLANNGKLIIINRGFIPQDMLDDFFEGKNQYDKEKIAGYVRKFDEKNFFTPTTDYDQKILYLFEKTDIKKIFNLNKIEPYFIDLIDLDQNIPQSNETLLKFPDNHLSYAITWYGLATALLFIYFYSRNRRKKK